MRYQKGDCSETSVYPILLLHTYLLQGQESNKYNV